MFAGGTGELSKQMLEHPCENAQRGDPCAEQLQSMVSSGIVIFGLKQSSELACNPGMLSS